MAKVEELHTRFPKLFPPTNRREGKTPFEQWGFQIGDGWFDIMEDLATKLSALSEDIVAEQVKEKFGILRVYIEAPDPLWKDAQALVSQAQKASETVCEDCSAPGKLECPRGYMRTVCQDCLEKWNKR